MTDKIFNFTVPVSGQESFSVVASGYQEALEKINNEDYYIKPELEDIDWDFGDRESHEVLPKCFTTEDFKEPSND